VEEGKGHRPLVRCHRKPLMYVVVIAVLGFLYWNGMLERFVLGLHELEYVGAFIAGIFYSYGMTTPLAILAFAVMARAMDPFALAFMGACGAMLSDGFIFSAVKGEVGREIRIANGISVKVPEARGALGRAALFLLGAVVLMSPLPDEVAAVMMGIGRIRAPWFMAIAFVAKFAGVLAIAGISLALMG
jgi:hypothetical protein